MNQNTQIRGLDPAALLAHLSRNLPDFDPAQAQLQAIHGGASNLTFLLRSGAQQWIVRTAPDGRKAASAHDMAREYRVLEQLHPHYPLCPEVTLLCEDTAVLGKPFYLMQVIEGTVIRNPLPEVYVPAIRPALCQSLIDGLAQLHRCDADVLQAFNKGRGYIERQVSGWIQRYADARTEDVPDGVAISRWLHKNLPADDRPYGPIHNDYKFDNLVFSPSEPARLIGVLDWEMATVGDPWMDVGCSLAYWVQADDPPAMQALRMLPTHLHGMYTRDEFVHAYASASGQSLDDYHYYYVFGLFRLAGIVQQIHCRNRQSQHPNPQFSQFGAFCRTLINHAEESMHEH